MRRAPSEQCDYVFEGSAADCYIEITEIICYTNLRYGVWRSLVARTAGGREVAGSNPVAPTDIWLNRL